MFTKNASRLRLPPGARRPLETIVGALSAELEAVKKQCMDDQKSLAQLNAKVAQLLGRMRDAETKPQV